MSSDMDFILDHEYDRPQLLEVVGSKQLLSSPGLFTDGKSLVVLYSLLVANMEKVQVITTIRMPVVLGRTLDKAKGD